MEGRLSEAEAGYRAIRAREPANPAVEFNLGIVLRRLGRLEEADAAVFFGRDAQILRGLDVLRGMRSRQCFGTCKSTRAAPIAGSIVHRPM